jgi:glyoxalase-like protein
MFEQPQLDHTVINVRYQMDEAEILFKNIGFHLTDRGYHTLGSINHLMMFGTDYLELIGLPEDGKENAKRPDIASSPLGINGLVFKTSDVDETFAHLQKIGMAGDPPKSFSRPVTLGEETLDACFRTAHVRSDIFPGGRVYFCEHGTPELVWRPEWQNHQNGVLSIPEFVVASHNHEQEAENFGKLLRADIDGSGNQLSVNLDGGAITILSVQAYRDRYGDLASSVDDRPSIFGAMVMRVDDLTKIRDIATSANLPVNDKVNRLTLRLDAFDSVLEFVA